MSYDAAPEADIPEEQVTAYLQNAGVNPGCIQCPYARQLAHVALTNRTISRDNELADFVAGADESVDGLDDTYTGSLEAAARDEIAGLLQFSRRVILMTLHDIHHIQTTCGGLVIDQGAGLPVCGLTQATNDSADT